MRKTRVIPTLLMADGGLVKTKKFANPTYVGDPINAIKIFNEKEIDELVFLDITASRLGKEPDYDLIEEFASEAFFPMAYGGGIKTVAQARRILRIGVEKIILGHSALSNPNLITEIADVAGSSSVVVCLDCRKGVLGKSKVHSYMGLTGFDTDAVEMAKKIQSYKGGEIILQAVDRDGLCNGYDLDLLARVACEVDIPVVALGGANSLSDFTEAHAAGASALSAGSFFVFYGKHQAVLITYPSEGELELRLP
ncbi:AglZ/HisF2 family acetamidino modification protein [Luminiphilus sp.]|nr:AglZ/HisF2 family acetamidino modification protein [Luminiphilus sp.]